MSRRPRDRSAYWDRQAPTYDSRMAWFERRFFGHSRRWIAGVARGRTLEIAIGTGANLAHYPDDVTLVGMDWSAGMLDLARRGVLRSGRSVSLVRADAGALPFADASFDTVVSTFALCSVPDERRALTEAVRVLRPGGRLLLADHVVATHWGLRGLQRLVELISVPWHGEHYTRRPVALLASLGVVVEESERFSLGAVERVRARKPA